MQIYSNFVEEIDAVDNGVNQYDGDSRYWHSSNNHTLMVPEGIRSTPPSADEWDI